MDQNYRILNRGNGIVACTIREMPEVDKKYIEKMGGKLDKLTFYFDKEHDLIVLNEDHEYFEQYAEIVITVMGFCEEVILTLHATMQEDMRQEFENLIKILLTVKKYRELKGGVANA